MIGGGDTTTCTIENAPNLVQRHLEWERVYHQFRVFLTITFLLRFGRFGRAGKGDLSSCGGWAGWQAGPNAGGRLTSVRVIRCRMHIHKNLGTQKSSMQPPILMHAIIIHFAANHE